MSLHLKYLEQWQHSKSRIFESESYIVNLSSVSGHAKKSRFLEIESARFIARATIWESGELDVEALDKSDGSDILRNMFKVDENWELEDKLNWWLNEIAVF